MRLNECRLDLLSMCMVDQQSYMYEPLFVLSILDYVCNMYMCIYAHTRVAMHSSSKHTLNNATHTLQPAKWFTFHFYLFDGDLGWHLHSLVLHLLAPTPLRPPNQSPPHPSATLPLVPLNYADLNIILNVHLSARNKKYTKNIIRRQVSADPYYFEYSNINAGLSM